MGHGLGSTVSNYVVDPLATIVTLTDYTAIRRQVGKKYKIKNLRFGDVVRGWGGGRAGQGREAAAS